MENNFYKLNDKEKAMMNKIQEITMTDFEMQGYYINTECLVSALEELLYSYDRKEEELEDYKQDVEDNFIRKSPTYDL